MKENVDALVISETKLDNTFPQGEFRVPGFDPPIQKDRNQVGGGIMVFVKKDFTAKLSYSERAPVILVLWRIFLNNPLLSKILKISHVAIWC